MRHLTAPLLAPAFPPHISSPCASYPSSAPLYTFTLRPSAHTHAPCSPHPRARAASASRPPPASYYSGASSSTCASATPLAGWSGIVWKTDTAQRVAFSRIDGKRLLSQRGSRRQ
eukprot:scaffold68831_cov68-Phaeocystis_antarctica.AAC.1